MVRNVLAELLLPFLGTSLGAGCVFFIKSGLNRTVQRSLTGFAAGVMVAASVWSLLIPAMEEAEHLGQLAFLPAVAGFWYAVFQQVPETQEVNTSTNRLMPYSGSSGPERGAGSFGCTSSAPCAWTRRSG